MKTQLFFISAICLLACSPHTNPITETNAQCTNLHQVSDIDDLLSQIYSNIDSSCLFDMPTAELEKIWGVKIFEYDYTKVQTNQSYTYPKENQINNLFTNNEDEIFLKKFDKYEQDFPNTLFLKKSIRSKIVEFRVLGVNRTNGQLPKLLPKPNEIKYLPPLHYNIQENQTNETSNSYKKYTSYIWHNKINQNSLNIQISSNINKINLITFSNYSN